MQVPSERQAVNDVTLIMNILSVHYVDYNRRGEENDIKRTYVPRRLCDCTRKVGFFFHLLHRVQGEQ